MTVPNGLKEAAPPDGSYVIADGPAVVMGKKVTFSRGADGVPVMMIEGFAPAT